MGRPVGPVSRSLDRRADPSWAAWSAALRAASTTAAAGEVDVVGRLLTDVAGQLGVGGDPLGLGRRPSAPVAAPAIPPSLATPDLLGAAYEVLLDPAQRRSAGRHYTSPDLALDLLTWALGDWAPPVGAVDPTRSAGSAGPDARPLVVVDPAVGGGALLLAAARWQVERGAAPGDVVPGLVGLDLDPQAVEVARASIARWAGAAVTGQPTVVVGDGLDRWPDVAVAATGVDLVVGNPPFLGQLSRSTARDRAAAARLAARFGAPAHGYVDTAALFLLAAAQRVRPGGRVVLIQPTSVLAARDAAGVREALVTDARLVGLWVAGEPAFAAEVDVCAIALARRDEPDADGSQRLASASPAGRLDPMPSEIRCQRIDVESASDDAKRGQRIDSESPPDAPSIKDGPISRRSTPESAAPLVALSRGLGFETLPDAPVPDPRSWAPLIAAALGVPDVALSTSSGCLGDLAAVTAGFRQHFYGLAPHLAEIDAADDSQADHLVPVLTTGLVDPLTITWGRRGARIAGRTWARPGVDLDAVERDDPAVGAWARLRLRPKVVVASQTRVAEAAVDATGRFLPGVPLVSVEPRTDDDLDLWLVAAALSAPPVTAWARRETAGTARHREALKLAARQVRAVPLPPERARWEAAARDLAAGRPLVEVGPELTVAYGLEPDHPVTAWWAARLASRRRDRR